jgi:hypothetical protein
VVPVVVLIMQAPILPDKTACVPELVRSPSPGKPNTSMITDLKPVSKGDVRLLLPNNFKMMEASYWFAMKFLWKG